MALLGEKLIAMALIKCPECAHDVSDQAASCPECGYPIQRTSGAVPASAGASELDALVRRRREQSFWRVTGLTL